MNFELPFEIAGMYNISPCLLIMRPINWSGFLLGTILNPLKGGKTRGNMRQQQSETEIIATGIIIFYDSVKKFFVRNMQLFATCTLK